MSVAHLIDRVHHTALCVQNFDRMHAFLTGFLGFEVEGERAERDAPELAIVTGMAGAHILWALLRKGSHRIELFQYLTPVGKTTPPAQSDTGFTHLAFSVSDVDAIHDAAVAAGHRPISAPQVMRGGVSRVFYLCGPENIVVEFMEFADRRNA
ncbi:VOC family protein [Roseovarius sp. C7]|uniref:VOC family protein n=1 Tax=Roseovarius sp. C7 TaxID=3398643 RepID=UPI0039F6932E